jgi:putative nucleotidyltransferase with HDIG domain
MPLMCADVDILFTSQDLYKEAVTHYSSKREPAHLNEGLFQTGNLRLRMLEDGECRDAIETGEVNRVFRKWKTLIAFIDSDYGSVQTHAGKGVQAIWFNREGAFVPSTTPLHDADILSFDSLSNIISILHKPSLDQCLLWWDEWDLPENVRRHARTVAWGAYILAVMMRNQDIEIDPILAHRGGLLHDIDKIKTLDADGQHGKMGGDFLEKAGYPALGEIVRGHIMHTILEPGAEERPWDVKLVYFMDKLVEGDQIVTFDERQEALKKRYPKYKGAVESAKSKVWALNDEICSILSISGHQNLISLILRLQNT